MSQVENNKNVTDQLANDLKQGMLGITSMFDGVAKMLKDAENSIENPEERQKFMIKLKESGVLPEFEKVREKLKDLHK